MMQTVRISDAVRCLLLNAPKGPNLACPRGSFFSAKPPGNTVLWRDALAQRRDRITLASWDGIRLRGLASARIRNGHRVWEIDWLYAPAESNRAHENGHQQDEPWDSLFLRLVDELVHMVGHRLGERVLLRLPSNSPMFSPARRAGFFPYFEESLLERQMVGSHRDGTAQSSAVQRRLPQDDYSLFQLYNAATPQQVRVGLGLTFDQWNDARERRGQAASEWVIRHEDRVTGWLGLWSHRGVGEADLVFHPDYPDALPLLLDLALAQRRLLRWLVPHYQEMGNGLIMHHGFQEISRYTVLIKTVAVPVTRREFAPVEA